MSAGTGEVSFVVIPVSVWYNSFNDKESGESKQRDYDKRDTKMATEKKRTILILAVLLLVALVILAVNAKTPLEVAADKITGYSPEAEKAIADFVVMYGKNAPGYDGSAYVVSDFDNTTSVFDITYQCSVYQLETMSFAMDPTALEAALGAGLDLNADSNALWIEDIVTAYSYLYETYGPFTAAGLEEEMLKPLHADPQWMEFAAKMRAFFLHVEDTTPEEVNYVWILFWYSGMTREEVYDLFCRSCAAYENVPSELVTWTSPSEVGSRLGVVSCEFTSGVSVPADVRRMMETIHNSGIDVWICSASHLDGVRAAVDVFGLSNCVTGVIGMTQQMENGVYAPAYDYETGYAWRNLGGGKWEQTEYAIHAMPGLEGKVKAIENALVPRYGAGPLAGFMDSSGDFNFCTEFDSLRMVICYNRANRKITEGGGLVAVAAVYQRESLSYDLTSANAAGDTYYLLQGRDENGLRTLRPAEETIRLGQSEPRLFANADNDALLSYAKEHHLTTEELFDTFAIATEANEPGNPLGSSYGHLAEYRGYHSISCDAGEELAEAA